MKKTRKAITTIMIIAAAAAMVLMPQNDAYASGGPGAGPATAVTTPDIRKDPAGMSAEEIIRSLYAREKDKDVVQCAVDSARIMTADAPVVLYSGYVKVGSYESDNVWRFHNISLPLGKYDPYGAWVDGKVIVAYSIEDQPTQESIAYNRACLELLYNTAWDLREQTEGMDDMSKIKTICAYLDANIGRSLNSTMGIDTGRTATCLKERTADCDGFAGLFYLIAQHCGINVRLCYGQLKSPHDWCMAEVDGNWVVVDIIQNYYPGSAGPMPDYKLIYTN